MAALLATTVPLPVGGAVRTRRVLRKSRPSRRGRAALCRDARRRQAAAPAARRRAHRRQRHGNRGRRSHQRHPTRHRHRDPQHAREDRWPIPGERTTSRRDRGHHAQPSPRLWRGRIRDKTSTRGRLQIPTIELRRDSHSSAAYGGPGIKIQGARKISIEALTLIG